MHLLDFGACTPGGLVPVTASTGDWGLPPGSFPAYFAIAGAASASTPSPETGSGVATVWLCRPERLAGDPCTADLNGSRDGGRFDLGSACEGQYGGEVRLLLRLWDGEPRALDERRPPGASARGPCHPTSREPLQRLSRLRPDLPPGHRYGAAYGGLAASAPATAIAYASIRAAFEDLPRRSNNDGRPFVLIGHSQGAGMIAIRN